MAERWEGANLRGSLPAMVRISDFIPGTVGSHLWVLSRGRTWFDYIFMENKLYELEGRSRETKLGKDGVLFWTS